MRDEFKILYILVGTFCICILMGMVGVFVKIVDPQFVEGLISGSLISMITMLFKDTLNNPTEVKDAKSIDTAVKP